MGRRGPEAENEGRGKEEAWHSPTWVVNDARRLVMFVNAACCVEIPCLLFPFAAEKLVQLADRGCLREAFLPPASPICCEAPC